MYMRVCLCVCVCVCVCVRVFNFGQSFFNNDDDSNFLYGQILSKQESECLII